MIAQQVELVAVVDADVRVDGPEQDAVDAAVALLQVVEVAVHGVAARDGIVEVAVLHHHLRLDEAALRPLEFGAGIDLAGESGADTSFGAIARDLGEPLGGGIFGGWPGDLLAVGRIFGVLRVGPESEQEDGGEPVPDAIRIQ